MAKTQVDTAARRVGRNVRRLRGAETLASLSARLDATGYHIGVTTLSKIELGQRPKLGVDDLEALASVFGVTSDKLLASADPDAVSRIVENVNRTKRLEDEMHEARAEAMRYFDAERRCQERIRELQTQLCEELVTNPSIVEHLDGAVKTHAVMVKRALTDSGAIEEGR